MIFVKLELWPRGDQSKAEDLGSATIGLQRVSGGLGTYDFRILRGARYSRRAGDIWRQSSMPQQVELDLTIAPPARRARVDGGEARLDDIRAGLHRRGRGRGARYHQCRAVLSTAGEFMSSLHIHHGPRTKPQATDIQKSAYCPKCKRRRVLTLTAHVSVEPSHYGPHFTWNCQCGGSKSAPGWSDMP